MKAARIAIAAAFAIAIAAPLAAIDLESITGKFGVAVINIERSDDSQPMAPIPIVNTLGLGLGLPFAEGSAWALRPALDFLWTNYEWDAGSNRAIPTESEQTGSNNVFVLGLLLDLPVSYDFRFSERLGGGVQLGLAALMRISLPGDPNLPREEVEENLAKVSSYFWGAARWLYPSFGLRFDVFLQEGFTFVLGLRGFLPIFNAWTGDAPFLDHLTGHVSLGMRLAL